VARQVTENLFERHLRPLFLQEKGDAAHFQLLFPVQENRGQK
jgi:hypothetical protein